ncbi:S8 family serine peptidase [Streptomyces sp. NPDC058620]|uniref:S8 family peptidase n=1 Tax=Streptomyces sp. NPDC058620 TaxID=3346560 RepID=UPI003666BAC7
MAETAGDPAIKVGLIDGPVMSHAVFLESRIQHLRPYRASSTAGHDTATLHGTATAGVLVGSRGTEALGVCPGVTLLSCPVFTPRDSRAAASPAELADAIVETTNAGARVINMSLSLGPGPRTGLSAVEQALEHAAGREVIVVAASGNESSIDGTALTRHRAVIPVVAYDLKGRPARFSNLGHSIGLRGVGAPGEGIVSVGAGGGSRPFGGSSAAAAIVTGAIALLWSKFPHATRESIVHAVTWSASRRRSVVPPLLNAWRAYEWLLAAQRHGPQEVQRG